MTDATDKKPPTYLSFGTGKPTVKRHIYFTCPLTKKYNYGNDPDKERADGTQDFRERMRRVLMWALRDGKIQDQTEFNKELEWGYAQIKVAEAEERNKPRYNPEYLEWSKNRPKKQTKPKKTKEPKEHTENRYVMLETRNKELMEQVEQLKKVELQYKDELYGSFNAFQNLTKEHEELEEQFDHLQQKNDDLNEQLAKQPKDNVVLNTVVNKVKELEQELRDKDEELDGVREDKDDLNYQIEHEHKPLDEYEELYDRKEHYKKLYNELLAQQPKDEPKAKKTNKGKKYNTKAKQIDNVIDELVNELDEPIDL